MKDLVKNKEETKDLAIKIAQTLKGGEVIFAKGPLGSGKTYFFQCLGKALKVNGIINSPTFNLIKIYFGKIGKKDLSIYHVDCYRLEDVPERNKDLGLEEVIGEENTLTYIEWPMYASTYIKEFSPRMEIEFKYIDENQREVIIDEK